jgi:sodium transport system ATP-binding protein
VPSQPIAQARTQPVTPILLEALSKDFAGARVVDGLSLSVNAGEVVGLLGPNGAGKTTTLRMLAGLLAPTAGRASVCGHDPAKEPLRARAGLGFLTASTGLYERLTGREILATFGALHAMPPDAIRARIDALAQELSLTPFLDARCGTLSSGQRQRISIARAVLHDPLVYVLDEPTAMLDPLASKAILELVSRVRAAGKAVLFSTHRMDEAEFLCDRIVFLRAGRAVADGSPAELLARSGQTSLTGAFLHYAEGSRA